MVHLSIKHKNNRAYTRICVSITAVNLATDLIILVLFKINRKKLAALK